MDSSFLIMLTHLLHLQNHLDPSTSLSSSSPFSLLTSSTAAPLLFFTLASILSYITSSPSPSPPSPSPSPSPSHSLSSFKSLSTSHIWSLSPSTRDIHWRSHYGVSYPVFTTLVDKLSPHITLSHLSLPPDYALSIVLSRLSQNLSTKTLAKRHCLTPYLISKITNMVTRLLATKLYPEFIKIPAGRRRLHETTQAFQELTGLPNLCGALDSSPVKLHRLPNDVVDGNSFLCPYGYPAVQLQVVADHKKVFWDVCVKAPGGVDDATHFRDSVLYHKLMSGDVVWDKVVNVRGHPVRPYLVGDWCFPLLSFLLTPFSGNGRGTMAQNAFDSALMRGRGAAVEAIGLLKGRWRILQDLNVGLHHAPQTIVACCVLHNLCQIAREPEPEEMWREPEESGGPPRVLESERSFYYYGENLRQTLADDLHQRMLSSR